MKVPNGAWDALTGTYKESAINTPGHDKLVVRDPLLPSNLSLPGPPSFPLLSFCFPIPLLCLLTYSFPDKAFTLLDLSCLFFFPAGQSLNAAVKITNITSNYMCTWNYFCEGMFQNFPRKSLSENYVSWNSFLTDMCDKIHYVPMKLNTEIE